MKKLFKLKIFGLIAGITLLVSSCEPEFLEVEPGEYATEEQVSELAAGSPEAVLQVVEPILSGIYARFAEFEDNHDQFGIMALNLGHDLMANDMVANPLHWFRFDYEHDNREANYRKTNYIWSLYYRAISNSNDILDFIPEGDELDPRLVNVRAQALAIRAYSYFQLIQEYQHTYVGNEDAPGIPIYDQENRIAQPRSTVRVVYERIIEDLDMALAEIPVTQPSKVQMNHNVVAGLKARVSLVMNDWANAQLYAEEARTGVQLMSADQWLEGFNDINNPEWMWGMDINAENSTIYASFFSHISSVEPGYAGLGLSWKLISKALYEMIPEDDVRKRAFANEEGIAEWATPDSILVPYTNFKFRGEEFMGDYLYMRAAEMYLIEAEAHARLGNEGAARDVLEALVTTRYPEYSANQSGDELIEEILLQRRIELWGEGFGFNDLRRLKRDVDRRNSNHNPGVPSFIAYPDARYMYKIPQREIDANEFINEGDQND